MQYTYLSNIKKCNYSKGDYDGLRNFMNRNWQQELSCFAGDANAVWSAFKSVLNEGINKYS